MGWLQKAGARLFPWKEAELCPPKAETGTKQNPACWKWCSISHLVTKGAGTGPQSDLWATPAAARQAPAAFGVRGAGKTMSA